MARRVPRDKRKYLKYDSDRSGFTYFKRELVKDGAFWVHPDEKDEPRPSDKPLGGEGDFHADGIRPNRNTVEHSPSVPDFAD